MGFIYESLGGAILDCWVRQPHGISLKTLNRSDNALIACALVKFFFGNIWVLDRCKRFLTNLFLLFLSHGNCGVVGKISAGSVVEIAHWSFSNAFVCKF